MNEYLSWPVNDWPHWELAREYARRTETFDMAVCSGWSERDRCAMPVGGTERGLVNRNATQIRHEMVLRCGSGPEFQRTLNAYMDSSEYRQDMAEIYQGWRPPRHR